MSSLTNNKIFLRLQFVLAKKWTKTLRKFCLHQRHIVGNLHSRGFHSLLLRMGWSNMKQSRNFLFIICVTPTLESLSEFSLNIGYDF